MRLRQLDNLTKMHTAILLAMMSSSRRELAFKQAGQITGATQSDGRSSQELA
jgi:hypothetical protein